MSRLPRSAVLGLALMIISEAAMLRHVEPFWTWHTPIAWTGYIFFVDGIVWARRGSSWLTGARAEFAFLAAMSVPLWLVFEAYNLLIHNWRYINLPSNLAIRYAGYAWSFATIWPGIFETSELIASFRGGSPVSTPRSRPRRLGIGGTLSIVFGAAMLIWPIVRPSAYLAAPVWLGFIVLLDPINARLGAESLSGDMRAGTFARLINLMAAGIACGILWECWNYWARTKWIYSVPIMENLRLFEMPLPGYLGFPVFALECFTMYVLARRCLWHGRTRPVGL